MNHIWPEIFTTGVEPENYKKDHRRMWLLCADGLTGWAGCMMKNKPPENFGNGMALIGTILGISTLGESLMEWAKKNPVPDSIKMKSNY